VGFLIAICTILLLGLVVLILSAPLRSAAWRQLGAAVGGRDELEAAREAKYREVRDAELDFRTGKLSSEDYEAIDSDLRKEALQILDRIESLDGTAGEDASVEQEHGPS
jgi:hypothetical protein